MNKILTSVLKNLAKVDMRKINQSIHVSNRYLEMIQKRATLCKFVKVDNPWK